MLASNALFLAGQPGLDFLNTAFVTPSAGTPVEAIGDGQAFLAWLVAAGLLSPAKGSTLSQRFSRAALDDAAAEARKFRAWAVEWLARWCDAPGADYKSELRRLNGLLARAHSHRRLVVADGRMKLEERCRLDAASELLALVAAPIALLLTSEAPELVKRCAADDCVLWFLDRTKAHRRLFCSASMCGNRAKVAAFRERQRDQ